MISAKMLPDAYSKSTDSNNYKLMQLLNYLSSDLQTDLQWITNSRDIESVTGSTLDKYGDMVGQGRNGNGDERFRIEILNKIASMVSNSDVNSFIENIARMLGVDAETLIVYEGDMSVTIDGIPLDTIESAGISRAEIMGMIKSALPVGVDVTRMHYSGTLLIGDYTDESPLTDYPQLFPAWLDGQEEFAEDNDIGLSGYGEVPAAFGTDYPDYLTSGTYSGGTLGTLE